MLGVLLLLCATEKPVTINGNIALPEAVYLSVLALTSSTSTPTADRVRSDLRNFLHASGYDLATVSATTTKGGNVVASLDEGRLDKIIFLDESAINALQLQIAFSLPGKIYNRPLLEKRLLRLMRETDVYDARYWVVPVEEKDHKGIQVEDPGLLIPGITFFKPGEPHELRIKLEHEGWRRGFDLGFGFKPPDGIFAKAGYKHDSAIFDRDRIELRSRGAIRLVDAFTTATARVGLSEASLGLQYFTPPVADSMRVYLGIEGKMLGNRREDLNLLSYLFSPVRGSLNFSLDIYGYVKMELGVGAEYRFLYAVRDEIGEARHPTVDQESVSQARMFARAEVEAIFNPEEIRRDRKHRITALAKHLSGGTEKGKPITLITLEYEKMFTYGWDEIWIGLTGASLFGQVPFYEEVPLGGDFLRGTFSQTFVRNVASVQLEYRLSLSRDFFKLGFYNDFAVYGQIEGADRSGEALEFGDTFGVALHIMALDTFLFSGFVGLGLSSGEKFDIGLGLEAKQVF